MILASSIFNSIDNWNKQIVLGMLSTLLRSSWLKYVIRATKLTLNKYIWYDIKENNIYIYIFIYNYNIYISFKSNYFSYYK